MSSSVAPTSGATTVWEIDPSHSNVEFAVKHRMISTVRGRFGAIKGQIDTDGTAAGSTLKVEIDISSIDTREEKRDAHLRSADFFDVDNHPSMTFKSKRIEGDIEGDFQVYGDLTIRGTTRPMVLKATSEGRTRDPWGGDRAGFSATGKISRGEFGLTWNQLLETGGVVVGDEIKITIDAEMMRKQS